jgi:hypothetical protein
MSRFAKLSRVKHQMGSGLAFAFGDVVPVRNSTDIRSITGRPSLFPFMLSALPSIHLAMGLPLAGNDTDLPCSVGMTRWVRSALYAGSVGYP